TLYVRNNFTDGIKYAGNTQDNGFFYTPPPGFTGTDTASFFGIDNSFNDLPGTVTITVVSASPTASSFTYGSTVAYNTGGASATTFSVTGNVTNSPTSYAVGSATTTGGGSVSINSSGTVSYTPLAGFRGNDTFTFTATNGSGTSGSATVTVPVGNPTFSVTLPASTGTVGTAYNSGASAVSVSGGKAPYSSFSATGLPAGLSMNSSGVISGTPSAATNATVVVTLTDSSTGTGAYTSTASASLTISAPTTPVASGFTYGSTVAYNTGGASATTFSVTGHVTNSPTSYAVGSATTTGGGSVSIDSSGTVSYTPLAGYRGNDTFTFTATNGGGTSGSATVTVPVGNPTFSVTLPASTGTVGTAYNSGASAVSVSGGKAPYSSFSATGLPAGLSMNSSGVISGTPSAATNATVVVTLTDSSTGAGAYTSTASASLTISGATITLPATSLAAGTPGAAYSATLNAATGGTAPYSYAVTSGALPTGVSLSAAGDLSGTPTAAGTFNFTVTVTDSSTGTGAPFTGSRAFTLTIGAPTVSLGASSLTDATIGAAYSASLPTATGGTAPYSYAVTAGALPTGVSLSAGGALSGTPTAAGAFNFTVTATDSSTGTGPFTGSQAYSLTVGAPTVSLPATSLTSATVGTAYSATLNAATGGTSPYGYAVTAGALPAGVTLGAAGALSGTPTAAGSFNFTVTATDSSTGTGAPFTASRAYSLSVGAPTVSLPATSLTNATVGAAYSATLNAATGGTAPYGYAVTAGALPAGVSLSAGGALSGTPTAAGAFSFTVTATDSSTGTGAPFTGARAYSLTVGAPTISLPATSLTAGASGTAYSATLNAASGGTAPYSYAVTAGALPAGVTLSTAGALAGTPTATGTFNFTVTATDSSTGTGPFTASRAYSLTIGVGTVAIAPASLPNAAQGTAYSQTISASGGLAPYAFAVTAGTLPGGLSLSGAGVLSGTPTANGTFNFTVTATDSTSGTAATASKAYALVVNLPSAPTAAAVSATVAANSSANPITLSLGGGAATSVAIATAAGHGVATVSGLTITYTPTAGYSGTDSFTYTATNGGGTSAPATVTITVTAPTLVVSGSPPSGAAASAYSASFSASGGTAPYAFTANTAPPGLSLSAAGVLSGTPTTAGTFPIQITATDANGATGLQTFSIAIGGPSLTISPNALAPMTVGMAFSQAFTVSGGQAPYAFGVSGVLPDGVTFDSTSGVLSGTPTSEGAFSFTITGTDSTTGTGAPFSASASFSSSVGAPVPPVVKPFTITPPVGDNRTVIDLTPLINGFYTTVFIVKPPQHGVAQVFGLAPSSAPASSTSDGRASAPRAAASIEIVYTPEPGYVGIDSFTYAASGPGGTSIPAAISIDVVTASPVTAADVAKTMVNVPVTIAVTANDAGPLDSIAIATPPQHGTAVVSGLAVIYTPATDFSGTDTFTYTAHGDGGTGAPTTVTVSVNPQPLAGAPITVNILAGQTAIVDLTANARGGPFTGAAVTSLAPSAAGTTSITSPSTGAYRLSFTPDNAFVGTAVLRYTLSNGFATSAPGLVTIIVSARPDPTADAEVRGLIAAQGAAARRFANGQIGNISRRLEQLHNGGGGNRYGVTLQGGQIRRADGLEAMERYRRYGRLDDGEGPVERLGVDALRLRDGAADARPSNGGEGGRPPRWSTWMSGAADFGSRDATSAQKGFRFTTDGLTAGVDYRPAPGLAVGVGVGYGHDSSRVGHDGTKSQADGYSASLYASYQPMEKVFIDALAGYGSLDYKTRRYVTATKELVHGDRGGDQLFAALTASLEQRRGPWMISPYGRIGVTRSKLDRFSETGGGPYALTYQSQTLRTLTGTLGLRGDYRYEVSFGQVAPRFRVEYAHDFESPGDVRLNYADWLNGPTYRLKEDRADRNETRLELGVDILTEGGLRMGVDFDNTLSANTDSRGLRVSVSTSF
ncbi:putative Ig domain-containing protein, partial [Caulobacter sp.]|uniref:putative Ig domain-containing protein n=1 Tax=Caulobacter sp. TaxID=78 RepID=UPI002B479405